MLRITTRQVATATPVVRLEGSLREPWVEELKRCVQGSFPNRETLRLDLSGLTFADATGVHLLTELIRQGAELIACSGYVAALLHLEKS
jgi:ABC-type transporter Mla MlaB component